MPLRFFHKLDDSNGNSFVNDFEDWFAAQGFGATFQSFLKNAANGGAPLTGVEGPLEATATAVPANSPLQYFIKINGVTGDATLNGFAGWIAVDGFDWGVANTTSVGSASGVGAGKTSFSPLTVDIHSLSALTALFSDAARGENLGTVELAAVDTVKGQTLKVYDIKLSDVIVSSFENDPGPNGIETAVAFDFAKAAVTVTPPTNNGRPGVPQTGAFDLTTLKATDVLASAVSASAVTTTQVSLASAATPVPANSPLEYFIKVNGVTGDATLKGFAGWIAVDGFDWGVENTTTIGSAGGGAGAGKTSFSPLTVDIHSLSGLAALFSDAARGENLGTVELAAVDTVKGQTLKVYDLKLSDVIISGFENDPGANGIETALAFDFAKANVTVTPPTTNGTLGVAQTGEFDLTTLKAADVLASDVSASAVATTQVPLASAATPVPPNSPLEYFIKINGVTGDATLKGFAGWIAVDGFDWGVENTTTIGSAGGGAGAGKTSFSPLTVDIHSLSGLAALFSDAARGENLGTVELAAVDTVKGQTLKVYDLKLSDVTISGFENDPGPNGIETALAFDFAKAAVTVTPPTSNGRAGVPQTGAFDLTTLKATDVLASDVSTSVVTTTQVPLASAATPVPANSPLEYFIKVNGVTGDATLKGFAGWFSVDGFDWGVDNTTSVGSASGAGAGKTSFSPLTVDIHSLSGLAALFSDAAKGENLGTVELAAVDTVKGQTLKVYDLKLSDVIISGFENDPGPNGIETALSFDFAKAAVRVTPPTNNGQPSVPQTGEFDLTTLKAADTLASDVSTSAVTTTQVSLAAAATPVPANSPLQYFIKVNGVTGDATLKGFAGWIAVDGFDWGLENTTTIGSAGGGASAGKTSFSPLTVDIHSLSGLAALFSDAAKGENLGTVELAAVDTVKGQTLKVYDIKLSDVVLTGFENDPGPNGIETALGFDFAKAAVTVTPPTRNGQLGTPQTGEFDLTTLKAADALASDVSTSTITTTQLSLASDATPVPANSPLKYFLKVDGATGDATQKGFAGWFSVDGFDWGVENTTTIGSAGGGAGAGKASFSPLTLDIHSLSGLAALFSDAARGENLGTVELAAVETIKGQTLKVFDIKLSDVFLTGFENDPGANGVETALAFDFAKASVTTQAPTPNGRPGVPQTTAIDLTTLKAEFSPSDLVFDPATSGAGLLAPASTGSITPQNLAWQPTLTSGHS